MPTMKYCPTCGCEAPVSAERCKQCFHDYSATKKRGWGPIILLGVVVGMTFVAAVVFWVVSRQPTDQLILVDQETKSIVITTQYQSGPSTERIPFADVVRIEHVAEGGAFRVVALTADADRKTLMTSDDEPLYAEAERYARVMEKPYERVGSDEELRNKAAGAH